MADVSASSVLHAIDDHIGESRIDSRISSVMSKLNNNFKKGNGSKFDEIDVELCIGKKKDSDGKLISADRIKIVRKLLSDSVICVINGKSSINSGAGNLNNKVILKISQDHICADVSVAPNCVSKYDLAYLNASTFNVFIGTNVSAHSLVELRSSTTQVKNEWVSAFLLAERPSFDSWIYDLYVDELCTRLQIRKEEYILMPKVKISSERISFKNCTSIIVQNVGADLSMSAGIAKEYVKERKGFKKSDVKFVDSNLSVVSQNVGSCVYISSYRTIDFFSLS